MTSTSHTVSGRPSAWSPGASGSAIIQTKIRLRDRTSIHVFKAGQGVPLVAVHGWSQSGLLYEPLLFHLSGAASVVAPDLRGHGRSDKTEFSWSVSRLAFDLQETLNLLEIDKAVLLGHSMGCGVIWAFEQLFGRSRIIAKILIDQSPIMINGFCIPFSDVEPFHRLPSSADLARMVTALRAPFNSFDYVHKMFTKSAPDRLKSWVTDENRMFPRAAAADLLFDAATRDWRSVAVASHGPPTLLIACGAGTYPVETIAWIAERGDVRRFRIFAESECGSHLVFLENPDGVSHEIRQFLRGLDHQHGPRTC